ncbi:MAG: PAS domain S-box protein [Polyangia bacterium]
MSTGPGKRIEHATMMTWCTDAGGRCTHFDAGWLAFTGRSLAEELGDGWIEGLPPEDRDRWPALLREHVASGVSFEGEHGLRRHDGTMRRVSVRAVPFHDGSGAVLGYNGRCEDIADLIVASEPHIDNAIFQLSLDCICVAGFDGYLKHVNPAWTKTLGWTSEDLKARLSIELVHPDDRAMTLAARQGLKEHRAPVLGLVNRYRCKDESYRWLEWRSVVDPARELVYAAARDVTEEREAQRIRGELVESLATTLDAITDGVIAVDAKAQVLHMNPVAESLTGWAAHEAQGKRLVEIFPLVDPTTRAAAHPLIDRALQEGSTLELAELAVLARGGAERTVKGRFSPMRQLKGTAPGAVLVVRDITAEKQAAAVRAEFERQLMVADRLASVGTLAGGVAHEINNPLAYLTANLDLVADGLRAATNAATTAQLSEWAKLVSEARDGAERIGKVVRGLMPFSTPERDRRTVIALEPALDGCIDLVFSEIRHRARLERTYGPVPRVLADEGRLRQVFVNLLNNAAVAIPEGNREANEIHVTTSTDAEGRAVIEFRDTGRGMEPHVLGRVFEPFFTTKAVGAGMGLGLSVCHSIVTALGGAITAENQPARGALIRVVLPAAPDEVSEVPAVDTPTPKAARGRATVLIIDDDRLVAKTLARVLCEHECTIVTDPREAHELILSRDPYDVILSDLMMPDMTGMQLHAALVAERPEAAERMVFISGGAFTAAARDFLGRVTNHRIEKPFDPGAVRLLVRSLIA